MNRIMTLAILLAFAFSPAAAQQVVEAGSTGNTLDLQVDNSSDLLYFKGGVVTTLDWSGIIEDVSPTLVGVSPPDLPPLAAGTAHFDFDVSADAVDGEYGYIDFLITTSTNDTAYVEVELIAGTVTDADGEYTPKVTVLYQNYPNPFNPVTSIEFDLPKKEKTRLKVYDVSGRLIRSIVDGKLDPGRHRFEWDGKNGRGVSVASGVYFYMLRSESIALSRKAVLLR